MLISGDDDSAMEFLLAGGCGVITVTGNVAPKLFHDMCMASIAGDRNKAQEINAKLERLNKDLFVESNPIPVKWCLTEMGIIPNWYKTAHDDIYLKFITRLCVRH